MPSRLQPTRNPSDKVPRTTRPVTNAPGTPDLPRESPSYYESSPGSLITVESATRTDWGYFDYKNSKPREAVAAQTNAGPSYQPHRNQSATSLSFLSPPSNYYHPTPPLAFNAPYVPSQMNSDPGDFKGRAYMSHDDQYPAFQSGIDNLMGNSPDHLAFNDSDLDAFFQNPMNFDSISPQMDINPASLQPSTPSSSIPQAQFSLQEASGPRNSKRTRNEAQPDAIQACWTSSFCPQHNHVVDGSHPDPATCEGACMPYLFSDPSNTTPNLGDNSAQIQIQDDFQDQQLSISQSPESGTPVSLKRGESFDSGTPTDRGETKPEPESTGTKRQQPRRIAKVKHEIIEPDEGSDEIRELSSKSSSTRPTKGRMPHNQVERKYRESLNAQLEALRAVVPSLQGTHASCAGETADMEDLPALSIAGKPSKAMILANAANYIKKLERERQRERIEIERLKDKLKVMEKLVSVGAKPNAGSCNECQVLGWVRGMKLDEGGAEIRLKSM